MASNIATVPYVRGIAEYACEVRRCVESLKSDDFVVAVDLPHGMEDTVIAAVKRLPRISLVIDEVGRAVPVLPTDAAIEAVRGFVDYGYDIEFLDKSVPLAIIEDEMRKLMRATGAASVKEALGKARDHGVAVDSIVGMYAEGHTPAGIFKHLAGKIGAREYARLFTQIGSEYMDIRQRHMAARLKRLAGQGKKVLFVCSVNHRENVLKYMGEPGLAAEDALVMKTVTCKVKESDVWKISPDIPYAMYVYESQRGLFFDRVGCLSEIFASAGLEPGAVDACRYAARLAIAEGQMYPDVYELAAAAKYCVSDSYAMKVYEKAISYSLAEKESNCVMQAYMDYDLKPLSIRRTLTLDPDGDRKNRIAWLRESRPRHYKGGIYHFTRTLQSQADELELMDYLRRKYVYRVRSDKHKPVEFTCGLKDGIDVCATMRYSREKKLYVKEPKYANGAAYVVNFGGPASKSIFFDTHYCIIGAARNAGDHSEWSCIAAFLNKPPNFPDLVCGVDVDNPFIYCVELALSLAKRVFVFTDTTEGLDYFGDDLKRVKVFGLGRIPGDLLWNMRDYYVER